MLINQQAFTLLEILISLTIMAIILAIAVPNLNAIYDRANDEIIQSQLLSAIEAAQNEALALHVPVAICKSTDHKNCGGNWEDGYLTFINEDKNGVLLRKEQLLNMVQTSARGATIHWRLFPFYREYLLFLPRSLATTDNGTFWLCHAKEKYPVWAIMMNKFGRTRVTYPGKDGEIKDSNDKALRCD